MANLQDKVEALKKKYAEQRKSQGDLSMKMELALGKPVFIVPFYVGLLVACQILMMTVYSTTNVTFKGWGVIICWPSHLLFLRMGFFLYRTKMRTLAERRNIFRGQGELNEYNFSTQYLSYENDKNEIFCYKLMPAWIGALLANLKIDLRKEHFTWWAVGAPVFAYILVLSVEGLHHGKLWWDDARQETRDMLSIEEEEGEGEGT
jgi:hypothetical protein